MALHSDGGYNDPSDAIYSIGSSDYEVKEVISKEDVLNVLSLINQNPDVSFKAKDCGKIFRDVLLNGIVAHKFFLDWRWFEKIDEIFQADAWLVNQKVSEFLESKLDVYLKGDEKFIGGMTHGLFTVYITKGN